MIIRKRGHGEGEFTLPSIHFSPRAHLPLEGRDGDRGWRLHTSLVTTICEQDPGKAFSALGVGDQRRLENGNNSESRAHSLPYKGLSRKKADSGFPSLSPNAILRHVLHFCPQQNEIQLIQLKQFWEQLLKAFNVR